jgi:hypothetical protein
MAHCDSLNAENLVYRSYLYRTDPTVELDGCCVSYPLDRDYWNNQLLDRQFLINYPQVSHIKYPVSENLCNGCNPNLKSKANPSISNRIWTIEAQGMVDGVSCQTERYNDSKSYWLKHNALICEQTTNGLPTNNPHLGQRLTDNYTQRLDINGALQDLETRKASSLSSTCCPLPVNDTHNSYSYAKVESPAKRPSVQNYHGVSLANSLTEPWWAGNKRNVDAESALMGINYLNNADCYQNKICNAPLSSTSDVDDSKDNSKKLFSTFYQDVNCIYPNYTPKFWDNLTKAKSGAQLVSETSQRVTSSCKVYRE